MDQQEFGKVSQVMGESF